MTFDKEAYQDRRSRGLKGQQPMTTKEIKYEVRKKLKKDMIPTVRQKITDIIKGDK